MGLSLGLGLGLTMRRGSLGGVTVDATVSVVNPFTATATPPDGYQFVAGAITIIIPAKPATFGVSGSVAGSITTAGVITETTAGQVETAIMAAGWSDGDDVPISISGATYDVYVSTGPVAALTSVSRVGDAPSSNIILHPAMAVSMAPRDLVAFYISRSIGNISSNQFTFDGATMTEVAADVTVNTSGHTGARKLTNPQNVSSGAVSMTGLSASTSTSSTMVLLSIDNSDLFSMTTVAPGGSITSADAPVSVLPGDVLISIVNCFGVAGSLGTVTWSGTSEISASAQCGGQLSYSAVAMQTVTETNAAYVVGASWAAARSNCTHSVLRIRKA